MAMTDQEMATEIVKSWISSKSGSADGLARDIKIIFEATVEAIRKSYNINNE